MLEQINAVKEQGFKPVLYIDNILSRNSEMTMISRQARKLDVPVYYESDTAGLNKIHKAYVFRYGTIPQCTEAMVNVKVVK